MQQCPRCHAENREGRRFCGECGLSFASACPSCGFLNEGGEKFCGGCGRSLTVTASPVEPRFSSPHTYTPKHLAEKILTSKSALEGERKQVTVLFADLKGSMELLADRDPEEARKILDPVLERMMEAVHRYEGTVNQVMGDGIMALFGAPIAQEDHAIRACYAALSLQGAVKRYAEDLRRAEGIPIQIRVGLNSGEVVVRSIGSDLRMDYTAVGQTTHLAARMEQMATPGTILLTSGTLTLAEGFVQVASLGPMGVKGLPSPIEIFELTAASPVRSRLQAAAARGLTRFVGRGAEIELLRQALERAGGGRGQVVAVVGEPGVGKSRLVWEFTHSHRTHGCLLLEAASVSYGKATTYLPLVELLKSYFQIEARDDGRKMREKVTGKLLSLDRALEPALPVFLSLLDVPVEDPEWTRLDPPQRRRQTQDALKRLVLRESQVQPVLLVVEDLHWIDAETQAWLDLLVESVPTARLLLLVDYRPEYGHGWGRKTYYQQVRLDALPTASAAELVEALLGTASDLEPLQRLLIERTQGNPFFIEESVRALVETRALAGERGAYRLAEPIQNLQLPATAQAILAARIDRLASGDKRLLQAAAVIGKDVPFPLLEAIGEEPAEALREALARLQAGEFLYEARLFPELEYTFKHALTHEVTYRGLLQDRRRALHARIVDAIETLHRDRLGEHVERLAHHALRGELGEKAIDYLRQAGLKAAAQSALPDARTWFEQALGVLQALPENRSTLEQGFEIRLGLRAVLTQLGELRPALESMREAEALAERLNDEGRRGRVHAFMMHAHSLLGELDEALATGTHALEIARRLGDLPLRLLATPLLLQAHYHRGEYERVVEVATESLAALPADWIYQSLGGSAPPAVYVRFRLIITLAQLGRFGETAEPMAEAIRIAEVTQHAFTIQLACRGAGTLHLFKGEWLEARSQFEHAITSGRTNAMINLPLDLAASAWVLAQLGEAGEALSRLRESEQLSERQVARGTALLHGWNHHMLARGALLLGRLDHARSLADRALEFVSSQPGQAAHVRHLLGDIATHPEQFNPDKGAQCYREALALAEERKMRPLVAHCHAGLGRLYHRTGKHERAQEHLATATTMYREMGMTYWLEKTEAELR